MLETTMVVLSILVAIALVFTIVIEVIIQRDDFFNIVRAYKAAKRSDIKEWKVKSKTWINGVTGQRQELLNEVEFKFDERKYEMDLSNTHFFLKVTHGWVPLGDSAYYDIVGKTGPTGAAIIKRTKNILRKRSEIILDIHRL